MTRNQSILKRCFDILLSAFGLIVFLPIIVVAWIVASFDTKSNGMFKQERVGRNAKLFTVYKIKTMRDTKHYRSPISGVNKSEITSLGILLRRYKIDELPQLYNVFLGQMSFVGPRPDVPGYADRLTDKDKLILSIRPGITGPASLKYRNEEEILQTKENPRAYNDEVIWPDKVKLNIDYINNYSFLKDLKYIVSTITG